MAAGNLATPPIRHDEPTVTLAHVRKDPRRTLEFGTPAPVKVTVGPRQKPRRRYRTWPWIVAVVLALIVLGHGAAGHAAAGGDHRRRHGPDRLGPARLRRSPPPQPDRPARAGELTNEGSRSAPRALEVTGILSSVHPIGAGTGDPAAVGTDDRVARVADLTFPLVIAHRGGANLFPENTMAAYEGAAAMGCQAVEAGDLQLTSDGALVAMHDTTVDRTTDGSGNVAAHTLAGIRALRVDASRWFGGRWTDQPVPTFADILDRLGGHGGPRARDEERGAGNRDGDRRRRCAPAACRRA